MNRGKKQGKCAVVQMNCEEGNLTNNTIRIAAWIQKICREAADISLILFPEMILYGYSRFEEISKRFEQKDIDLCLNELAKKCVACQVNIVVGAPKIEGKRVENALYYIDLNGRPRHVYSKVHLIENERMYIHASDYYTICETPLGKTGFLICWDSAFSEAARLYKKLQADAIIVCAAWEEQYLWQWKLAVAGRSFDNSVPVFGSNRVGNNGYVHFAGHAMITDCMGNIVKELKSKTDDYLIVDIEQAKNKLKLKEFGSPYGELRNDTYTLESVQFIK